VAGTLFTIPVVSVGFDVSAAPDSVRGVHGARITGALAAARVRRWLQSLAPLRRVSVVSLPIPMATKCAGSVSGVRRDRHDATPNLLRHARSAFPRKASAIPTTKYAADPRQPRGRSSSLRCGRFISTPTAVHRPTHGPGTRPNEENDQRIPSLPRVLNADKGEIARTNVIHSP
jgi:hypothetical protein